VSKVSDETAAELKPVSHSPAARYCRQPGLSDSGSIPGRRIRILLESCGFPGPTNRPWRKPAKPIRFDPSGPHTDAYSTW